jgi:hypothetical protein
MSPRARATSIERTATAEDVLRLARSTGHSRFPVTGEDWDDIDGIVHVKRAIAVPHDRRADVPVSALMVPPLLVPETIRLDPLLLLLRWNVLFISIAAAASAAAPSIILRVGDATDEKEDGGRGQDSGSIHWVLPPGNHPWRIAKVLSDFSNASSVPGVRHLSALCVVHR